MGVEDGAGILQNSLVVLQKVKQIYPWTQQFHSWVSTKRKENMFMKNLYMNADGYSSIIRNSQRVEITHAPYQLLRGKTKYAAHAMGYHLTIKNRFLHKDYLNPLRLLQQNTTDWLTYKQQVSFSHSGHWSKIRVPVLVGFQ